MQNLPKQANKGHKKFLILITISVVFLITSLFAIKTFLESPRDLGSKLHYVGSADFGGCILFYCEGPTGSVYYFETDMSRDEIAHYFKKTEPAFIVTEPGPFKVPSTELAFNLKNESHGFSIYYFEDGKTAQDIDRIRPVTKRSVISISNTGYMIAKESL